MLKKPFSAAVLATALTASVFVPIAVSPAEAATLSVSDYVVQTKDGNLYTLDLPTYLELRTAKVPFLQDVKVTHIKASNGKIYELDEYKEAKGATTGGDMNTALQALEQFGTAKDIDVGKVVVDDNGNIELEKPAADTEFRVLSIE